MARICPNCSHDRALALSTVTDAGPILADRVITCARCLHMTHWTNWKEEHEIQLRDIDEGRNPFT